jgi:hypothetical protein
MVTFDGVKIQYIGDFAAFDLYINEPHDKWVMRALMGSISSGEAEKALKECESTLAEMLQNIAS